MAKLRMRTGGASRNLAIPGRTTIWLLVIVVVVLAGVPGTLARWGSTIPSTGSVQAADFRVTVSNGSRVSTQMPAPITLVASQNRAMTPGQARFYEMTAVNESTARSEAAAMRLSIALEPYAVDDADPSNRSLAGNVSLAVATAVPVRTDCTSAAGFTEVKMSAIAKPGKVLTSGPTQVLPKDGSGKWCFRVTLNDSAPASAQGRKAMVNVRIQADQEPAK